jgi:hypothetical protein
MVPAVVNPLLFTCLVAVLIRVVMTIVTPRRGTP